MASSSDVSAVMLAAAQYLMDENEDNYINPNAEECFQRSMNSLRITNGETSSRTYKYRSRALYAELLYKDYFAPNCVYTATDFRRRFRMRRTLFLQIVDAVKNNDPYFIQKPDCIGKPGHDPLTKIVSVFRMICYGNSADSLDEHFRIGKSTVLKSVDHFCDSIIKVFGEEYTRYPTQYDIERIMPDNVRRGFPGMLGSVDCMHWEWKNCPSAWSGQFRGHYAKPTIVLEAVATYDTWFWHSFFGMPGSNNDLNVLSHSNLFHQLHMGIAPATNFTVNGNFYKYGYYLADGIYPKYATIVQGYPSPVGDAKIRFSQFQSAARKDVERAFGILQSRFAIVAQPARHWDKDSLAKIMKTCVILHNMIVEDERRDGAWKGGYDHTNRNAPPVEPDRTYNRYVGRRHEAENVTVYHKLRKDLVHHIWHMHPGAVPEDD